MTPPIWTLEHTRDQFLAIALQVGGTPRSSDIGQRMTQGINRLGYSLPGFAEFCGLVPNRHKGPRQPLPSGLSLPEEPRAEVVASPHALSAEELERERQAHLARMKERYAKVAPDPRIRVPGMSRRGDFFGRKRSKYEHDYVEPGRRSA